MDIKELVFNKMLDYFSVNGNLTANSERVKVVYQYLSQYEFDTLKAYSVITIQFQYFPTVKELISIVHKFVDGKELRKMQNLQFLSSETAKRLSIENN